MLENEKGLTLVEVMAALVLTLVVLGFLIFLLNQTNSGVNQVSSKEEVMQESRDIINHIVSSARKGLIAPDGTYTNLRLTGRGTQFAQYTFDSSAKTFAVEALIANDNGDTPSHSTIFVLSEHVASIAFNCSGGKIEMTITMALPGNQTYTTSTTVNSVL